MDHAYVPILYLIYKEQIIKTSKKNKLKLNEDFPSQTDFFQRVPIIGKLVTGDGLLRIYIFRKY